MNPLKRAPRAVRPVEALPIGVWADPVQQHNGDISTWASRGDIYIDVTYERSTDNITAHWRQSKAPCTVPRGAVERMWPLLPEPAGGVACATTR